MKTSKGMMFYRCLLCTGVVSKWDIREVHGCPNCGARKLGPTNLSIWEKLVQIFKHPKVWNWDNDADIIDPPRDAM